MYSDQRNRGDCYRQSSWWTVVDQLRFLLGWYLQESGFEDRLFYLLHPVRPLGRQDHHDNLRLADGHFGKVIIALGGDQTAEDSDIGVEKCHDRARCSQWLALVIYFPDTSPWEPPQPWGMANPF